MLLLGLVCILLGVLAILAAVFVSSGAVELLGIEMNALVIFLIGVASGALVLWGLTLTRLGAKREMRNRREHRKLTELSQKLDRIQPDRDQDQHRDSASKPED